MTILRPFETWPQTKDHNNNTIDEGLVTLIAKGRSEFIRFHGRNPTTIILGNNASVKFTKLPEEYHSKITGKTQEIFGMEIIFAIGNGIWLF